MPISVAHMPMLEKRIFVFILYEDGVSGQGEGSTCVVTWRSILV